MSALKIAGILTALLVSIEAIGQNAAAELHFESAEKAYNAGNYLETIRKLDDVERITGPMSKTLYLRIRTQDKQFNRLVHDIADLDFEMLKSLRNNTANYLEVMESHGLDDRYREVFRIAEGLKQLPGSLSEVQHSRQQAILERQKSEEPDYQNAITKDNVTDYLQFLSRHADSHRLPEIRERLAVAKEREAYQLFSDKRTSIHAEKYLREFPDGANKDEVLALYEDIVFSEGIKHEEQGELAFARERFTMYKRHFSQGKYIIGVEEKLKDLENKINPGANQKKRKR